MLATEDEQQEIAVWNGTAAVHPQDACVPALVAAQAMVIPGALAVASATDALTYGELDRRANRLAHHLASLGAGPDRLVALLVERSTAFAVAALGILKCGAPYLPLDRASPADRLDFMLKNAEPVALVTERPLLAGLPSGDWEVVCLEDTEAATAERGVDGLSLDNLTLDHLAYVIYTSGSTGRPKGVEITHRSLLNLVFWHRSAFAVDRVDRATQIARPGFDAAVWELWPYLTAGASIHLPDETARISPERLRDWLVEHAITITFLPTPLAERMMMLDWPQETRLRVLLTGGDTLHRHPPASLPFAVVNNYGPTECTVVATSGLVPNTGDTATLPSIGRPIANTQVHILDGERRPVAIGVTGELYVGGVGVARGYRQHQELTRQRFIHDPFAKGGALLYRTGDLARWLPDGRIAFLGRADEQIKIRGFRIEPDEIVAALDAHPSVVASAVAACDRGDGDRRLVAYVVPAPSADPSPRELLAALRASVPDYMVPSVFVSLSRLPLTPNGKVNRAALPMPDAHNTLRDADFVAPRTEIETRVADIMTCLLGVDEVGATDNFFLLGGHSLLGTQVISRVRETFGVELSLRFLFENPTVEALAAEIERAILVLLEAESDDSSPRLAT